MKRVMCLVVVCLAVNNLITSETSAIKYKGMKEIVQAFAGDKAQLFQKEFLLTPEQKTQIKTLVGWTPAKDDLKVYYAKDASDQITVYVLFLDFTLPQYTNCFHKFGIGMDAQGTILGLEIVELTDPYSFSLDNKSFLTQFNGQTADALLKIPQDIKAVTGATESSRAVGEMINGAKAIYKLVIAPAFKK